MAGCGCLFVLAIPFIIGAVAGVWLYPQHHAPGIALIWIGFFANAWLLRILLRKAEREERGTNLDVQK